MTRFAERTGCPVMINTSFNVRGEPIVCAPEHAYRCFMGTDMDVLVLENFLLLKEDQPRAAAPDRDDYLAQFELD
jgi:carbamoyltransferase